MVFNKVAVKLLTVRLLLVDYFAVPNIFSRQSVEKNANLPQKCRENYHPSTIITACRNTIYTLNESCTPKILIDPGSW